jgi:hypothetical protein
MNARTAPGWNFTCATHFTPHKKCGCPPPPPPAAPKESDLCSVCRTGGRTHGSPFCKHFDAAKEKYKADAATWRKCWEEPAQAEMHRATTAVEKPAEIFEPDEPTGPTVTNRNSKRETQATMSEEDAALNLYERLTRTKPEEKPAEVSPAETLIDTLNFEMAKQHSDRGHAEIVANLAAIDGANYQRLRASFARMLDMNVVKLDSSVKKARAAASTSRSGVKTELPVADARGVPPKPQEPIAETQAEKPSSHTRNAAGIDSEPLPSAEPPAAESEPLKPESQIDKVRPQASGFVPQSNPIISAAAELHSLGVYVVPIPRGTKGPVLTGWPDLRLGPDDSLKYFAKGEGIGALLGIEPAFVVDLDVDDLRALRVVADRIIPGQPATAWTFGRESKPRSHHIYGFPRKFTSVQFWDDVDPEANVKRGEKEKHMILELRGTKEQTVFPPTVHPSGESIEWAQTPTKENLGPASVGTLQPWASRVAAATLLGRHYPAFGDGHRLALALAGWLGVLGWHEEDVKALVTAAAIVASDPDVRERQRNVASTYKRLAEKQDVEQRRHLEEALGENGKKITARIAGWLGLQRKEVSPQEHDEALQRIDAILIDKNATVDLEDVIRDSGLLSSLDYEQRRKQIAARCGITRVKVFDEEVTKRKQQKSSVDFDMATTAPDVIREKVAALVQCGQLEIAEQTIWEWIKARAQVFCDKNLGYLLFNDGDGVPIAVTRDGQDLNFFLISIGIHPGSPMRERVGKFIGTMCHFKGIQTETRLAFHYDRETFTAYAAVRRGVLIRIRSTGLEEVPNGSDGHLFIFPSSWQPLLNKALAEVTGLKALGKDFFTRTFHEGKLLSEKRRSLFADSYLERRLFHGVHFDAKGFTQAQVKVLLLSCEMLLMLPGAARERVLLEVLGESGSGKTFFAVLLGIVLLGPNFEARPMPSSDHEYENQAINEHYVVYDNVGQIKREVAERICQSVTGFQVVRRELFTTAGEFRASARATNALSAINPALTELEHKNRAVTIRFKERKAGTYVSETALRASVLANRDDIVLNLLRRLVWIVEALEAQRDYTPGVNIRLASVATFILRVARHEGWESDAWDLLTAWESEQVNESLSDDDLCTAIARFLIGSETWRGNWYTGTNLNEDLVLATVGAPQEDEGQDVRDMRQMRLRNLSWQGNMFVLVKKLGANFKVYVSRFGLRREKNVFRNSRGNWAYRFDPSREQLDACRELAAGVKKEQEEMPRG